MLTGNETIVIRRAVVGSGTDDYGLEAETTTDVTVTNCLVAFGSTGEPVEVDRNPIDEKATVYFPAGTQIEPLDKFQIRGLWWVKDGSAQSWTAPYDFETGVVVSVRRRIG